MWVWMVSGFVYYGFSFSWASLNKSLYISYLLAATGEVITYVLMVFPLEYFGRKKTHVSWFLGGDIEHG